MNNVTILYIYHKNGEIELFNDKELTNKRHQELLNSGWTHTATLDPAVFLKHITTLGDADILTEIKAIKSGNNKNK